MNYCKVCGDEFTKTEEEGRPEIRYERCNECYSKGLLNDFANLIEILKTAKEIQDKE